MCDCNLTNVSKTNEQKLLLYNQCFTVATLLLNLIYDSKEKLNYR